MPPVLGPRSPSSRRLWSCDVASGSTASPRAITMKLTSSPCRTSSTTTVRPALPKFQAGRGARWTEAGAASGGEPIDDAGDQRALGSHDGEPDRLALREGEQGVD